MLELLFEYIDCDAITLPNFPVVATAGSWK